MAEAEAAFRTALKLQPAFALPHARLATLLRDKLPDEDLAALEERLADEQLGQGPRARLLVRPGPRSRRPGRLRARRRVPATRPTRSLWSWPGAARITTPPITSGSSSGLIRAFDARVLRATGWLRG